MTRRTGRYGNKEIIKLLLKTGIDANAKDRLGWTAVMAAVVHGKKEVVKLLVEDDRVDLNLPQNFASYNRTPLFQAAWYGKKDMVQLLLSSNRIDTNARDWNGYAPLIFAAQERTHRKETVQLLLGDDRVDPNARDTEGRTALSHAAESGSREVIGLLLDDDRVDPNIVRKTGNAPLTWAIRRDCYTYVFVEVFLKSKRVDPNISTPLWKAVSRNWPKIVEQLLGCDRINPNLRGENGRTPLSEAAGTGNFGSVKRLLDDDRVDPNAKDSDGKAPLPRAEENGHEDIAELLRRRL